MQRPGLFKRADELKVDAWRIDLEDSNVTLAAIRIGGRTLKPVIGLG
jgi:hypothetical protein